MTYDRRQIMQRAWEIIRAANVARFGLAVIRRNALRTAWAEAKAKVRALRAAASVAVRLADPVAREILEIETRERLTSAQFARLSELYAARIAA